MSTANDRQVAGDHYKGDVQHWDYAADYCGRGYFTGQISKYLWRWRRKNGVQDLKKAQHFIQKLREIDAAAAPTGFFERLVLRLGLLNARKPTHSALYYFNKAHLNRQDIEVIHAVHGGRLADADKLLQQLITLADDDSGDATAAYVDQDRGDTR